MANRGKRKEIAHQTLEILQTGQYRTEDEQEVTIQDSLDRCVRDTLLYGEDDELGRQLEEMQVSGRFETQFVVLNCTTLAASREIIVQGVDDDPVCLNFASAKNPGGGFLGGSQAQEESLARASGLYASINPQQGYYQTNRNCGSALYTDHLIYSPHVPVFRDDADRLLSEPYHVSMITSPAVNAGALLNANPGDANLIAPTMRDRIHRVLAVAYRHGHESLVLGAWGCGVFRNDPAQVAGWFSEALREGRFRGAFRHVCFAVLDSTAQNSTFKPFADQFSSAVGVQR